MKETLKLPRICIAAIGRTPGELLDCARRALEESAFVELRLDWVAHPAEAIALIPRLLQQRRSIRDAKCSPILQATCRRKASGGMFNGTAAQQMQLLHDAAQAGCAVLDLEIESAEAAGREAVAALREHALLILSFHDFHSTPALGPVARRLCRFPSDFYKVVPTATRQSDNVAVLEFLSAMSAASNGSRDRRSGRREESREEKWIAFAMGEAGVPSRVLALAHDSALIYAAPSESAKDTTVPLAAPGQVDATTLRSRYRADRLTRATAIFGVLGNPVKQSIGVVVHNAAFRARRDDAVYLPLLASDMREFHKAAKRYPLAGFSVTIPHKQAVLRYVQRADRLVRIAGAANAVRIRRGRWEATNTDVAGIVMPLRKRYRLASGERLARNFRAVIVGNGGAARAAVIGLRTLGCRTIFVAGRAPEKLRRFAKELRVTALPLEALRRESFDLLIHSTPVGMWPRGDECLLTPEQLRAETVFDLVYNPPQTRLLQLAKARGCHTISGIEMYLAQAAEQFEFWTGKPAPLRTMREAALRQFEVFAQSPQVSPPALRREKGRAAAVPR